MAKDDRKILRGVRVGTRTITDPDELARAATASQIGSLQARGYLSGEWGGRGSVKAKPASAGDGGLPEDFPSRELLAGAGFTSVEAVRSASDEDLLAVDGIGEARLKEIRKAVQ